MGTNFYYRINGCGYCARYDEVHVGKRSVGWSFGFRGYQHRLMDEAHPDWGYTERSPFGFPVLSRADWRKAMTAHPGALWDEYGRRVEGDAVAWLDSLPAPDVEQQRNEDGMTSHPVWMEPRAWRDPEGFRFDSGEFC